ncbi:hypothetical protein SPI_03797 [Niveomyces insectorum RCEF 264]|uniref:Transmembrane protein n=1 Tax=Niveomyces insectorum RCEF 264 TaxID=1081102 RepID=A0A167WD37_9HYPO|nr:hypothetical protein SPI_03797 [Niveomyces insectorum RCEF 264]
MAPINGTLTNATVGTGPDILEPMLDRLNSAKVYVALGVIIPLLAFPFMPEARFMNEKYELIADQQAGGQPTLVQPAEHQDVDNPLSNSQQAEHQGADSQSTDGQRTLSQQTADQEASDKTAQQPDDPWKSISPCLLVPACLHLCFHFCNALFWFCSLLNGTVQYYAVYVWAAPLAVFEFALGRVLHNAESEREELREEAFRETTYVAVGLLAYLIIRLGVAAYFWAGGSQVPLLVNLLLGAAGVTAVAVGVVYIHSMCGVAVTTALYHFAARRVRWWVWLSQNNAARRAFRPLWSGLLAIFVVVSAPLLLYAVLQTPYETDLTWSFSEPSFTVPSQNPPLLYREQGAPDRLWIEF